MLVSTDINECVDGTGECQPNAMCVNTNGDYECNCLPGYTSEGENCIMGMTIVLNACKRLLLKSYIKHRHYT